MKPRSSRSFDQKGARVRASRQPLRSSAPLWPSRAMILPMSRHNESFPPLPTHAQTPVLVPHHLPLVFSAPASLHWVWRRLPRTPPPQRIEPSLFQLVDAL